MGYGVVVKAALSVIAVFAVIALLFLLTEAHTALAMADPFSLALASFFFMASVVVWIVSWAFLIRKRVRLSYSKITLAGLASMYGSLTPVQLGAEALRSINLKKYFGVGYSDSVSASMAVKGTKFSVISLLAVFVFVFFLATSKMPAVLFLAFASGLLVVVLAALLFLAPLWRPVGVRVAWLLSLISKRVNRISRLPGFFLDYSDYLQKTRKSSLAVVFVLSLVSWLFEFLALQWSFFSLDLGIALNSLLVLTVLVSVLERTPFLPRGVGVVEVVGYYFLSIPSLAGGLTLTPSQIGAVLVVFDVARLVVPALLSIAVSFLMLKLSKQK